MLPAAILLPALSGAWSAALAGWEVQARLAPQEIQPGDAFGHCLAIDAGWLAVGAPRDDDLGADCGAVYLFALDGDVWTPRGKLMMDAPAAGAAFGQAVALRDGTLVVGAYNDDGPVRDCGAAYVFRLASGVWTQQARLLASDPGQGDSFGWSVAVSGDTIVVGAYADADGGRSSGSAYAFEWNGTLWQQTAKLVAAAPAAADYLGWSVGIWGDAIVAGAYGDDDVGNGSGSAWVFQRGGGAWSRTAELLPQAPAAYAAFGRSVAICGQQIAVAAPGRDALGAVYVFRQGPDGWQQAGELLPAGGGQGSPGGTGFGCQVAIDGAYAGVGAWLEDAGAADSGAAYVFRQDGDLWRQADRIAGPAQAGAGFGWSVALGGDLLAVGALGEAAGAGAVYLFRRATRTDWRLAGPVAGLWSDPNNWTSGLPADDVAARVDNGGMACITATAWAESLHVGSGCAGTVRVQTNALHVGDLVVGPQGAIQADANALIEVLGDLICWSARPGDFDLTAATVRLAGSAGAAPAQALKAAGEDRGADPAGWVDNFAIGRIIIASGAAVRLDRPFDGPADPNAGPGQALYVGELVLGPAARLDLNGQVLYLRNGRPPWRLLVGDTDLDGDVDFLDYLGAKGSFGTMAGAGWYDGDTDADGDVDFYDYLAVKGNFGLPGSAEPPAARDGTLPEPSALAMAFMAGAVLASRRRASRPPRRAARPARGPARAAAAKAG